LKGYRNQKLVIELSNIYGQKVKSLFTGTIEDNNWKGSFDLNNLSKGIYILTISGKELTTLKIIKL